MFASVCHRLSSTRMHWQCTWERIQERSRTSVQSATIPTRSLDISSHTRRLTRANGPISARRAASRTGSALISASISSVSTTTARRHWSRRSQFRILSLNRPTPWTPPVNILNWFSMKELSSELYSVTREFRHLSLVKFTRQLPHLADVFSQLFWGYWKLSWWWLLQCTTYNLGFCLPTSSVCYFFQKGLSDGDFGRLLFYFCHSYCFTWNMWLLNIN